MNVKHRMTDSAEYQVWRRMKQRCNNPKTREYSYYGGRGICVCGRWNAFENFLADMGRAGPAASVAEPEVWQVRWLHDDGETWTAWHTYESREAMLSIITKSYDQGCCVYEARGPCASPPEGAGEVLAKYNELLYAVASMFPDESRHQTALRYIRERESRSNGPAQVDAALRDGAKP